MRWLPRLAPFCALPLAVAACGGSSRHALAPCTATGLRAHVGRTTIALSNYSTAVRLTNSGSGACTVDGYPVVRFLGEKGGVLGTAAHGSSYSFRDPGPRRIVLEPGKSASFSLHSTAPNGRPCRTSHRFSVAPPGSTTPLVLRFETAVCAGAAPDVSALVPGPQGVRPQ